MLGAMAGFMLAAFGTIALAADEPYARSSEETSVTEPYAKQGVTFSRTAKGDVTASADLPCKFSCLDAHPSCEESAKVIETVEYVLKAFFKGDLATVSKYLDDNCTTFDESTNTLIKGKQNVMADLKRKVTANEDQEEAPLISFTMDQPYAKVTGNTAVVSFIAIKVLGGKHPQKLVSHTTEVLVKDGDVWKKIHYRTNYKKVS